MMEACLTIKHRHQQTQNLEKIEINERVFAVFVFSTKLKKNLINRKFCGP
jgi:hypothetical protein